MVRYDRIFEIDSYPEYEPAPDRSLAAIARRMGRPPQEVAYDMLLEASGTKKLYRPIFNYLNDNYDDVLKLMQPRDTVVMLGAGRSHCGVFCHPSFFAFLIVHWVSDRSKCTGDLLGNVFSD